MNKKRKIINWSNTEVCPYCGGEWIQGIHAEGCMSCGEGVRYGY